MILMVIVAVISAVVAPRIQGLEPEGRWRVLMFLVPAGMVGGLFTTLRCLQRRRAERAAGQVLLRSDSRVKSTSVTDLIVAALVSALAANIAFEFASWISPQFKLYLITEFQRLKETERKQLGWDIRRNLARINYRIHTDAVKDHLIPPELTPRQTNLIYASEADVLNMALFGMTAKDWRACHPGKKGNIRDYANVSQLVCLSNLENLNALFIQEKAPSAERLRKLNQIAIQQMRLLTNDSGIKRLEAGDK